MRRMGRYYLGEDETKSSDVLCTVSGYRGRRICDGARNDAVLFHLGMEPTFGGGCEKDTDSGGCCYHAGAVVCICEEAEKLRKEGGTA